ncbi:GPP34 family phosphoprotein [Saccharopolyspora erythraea]|uniref:GOLPH3/VPS74 family protein n=1 Tax=Saccharopolyspora erythraea TaxID=1836 RepID=UPI001BA986A8|nr:GPP34 family phosphoprotein [Saccharopolyspora erythraea]QUH05585.1 GPP34 family phosphoprotein [Saccharopolyspora erythraea]
MSEPTLNLPEQFVLLLYKSNGSYRSTCDHTGAAELGEMVLRGRVEFEGKKVRVADDSPTGIDWVDEATSWLVAKSGPKQKPVDAARFIMSRRSARKTHCAALVQRGVFREEKKTFLGFPADRHYPDQAMQQALLAELHQVALQQRDPDDRLALLASLVHATGLAHSLRFDRPERKRLKEISKGENLGKAVQAVIASTVAVIGAATTASAGNGGGGDGGGGGGA